MRVIRVERIGILAALLALGAAGNGFAQTDNDGPSSQAVSAQAAWHQKVLKQAKPTATQSVEETPLLDNRPMQPASRGQWRNVGSPTGRQWRDENVAAVSYTPATTPASAPTRQRAGRTAAEEPEVIEPGPVQYEPLNSAAAAAGQPAAAMGEVVEGDDGGGDCEACGACGPHTDAFGYECFDGRIRHWWLRDLTLSAGVAGFKGPRDLDQNGNFGFQEGVGLSGPLGDPWNIGYQIGANFVQSDLSGTPPDSSVHAADRKQTFVTFGLFRRAECYGWQGGIAYDYMHDLYDVNIDLQQVRFELSYLWANVDEFGFYGATRVNSAKLPDGTTLLPTNIYALYARRYFQNGGDGRLYGGLTDYGDGVFGADLWLPLGRRFAVESGACYILPKEGRGETAQPRESWGLSMLLVWYPGRCAMAQQHNPYRPLFTTADNTTFMTERPLH